MINEHDTYQLWKLESDRGNVQIRKWLGKSFRLGTDILGSLWKLLNDQHTHQIQIFIFHLQISDVSVHTDCNDVWIKNNWIWL